MGEKADANVRSGVAPFLEQGETVETTLFAQPRGHSQAMAGGVAGMVGGKRAGNARRDAEAAGISLAGTMALVLTPTRLLMVETGNGGKVKGLLGAFSLADVGSMEVRRLGLGGSVALTVLGAQVLLEARVGAAREFADHLEQTKAA
ncbi:MAG: hypothetical protein QOH37_731 [Nocardioidaceae bacterium]|nr:hypothetical protein [Nocardioidaceae bacterium]